MLKESEKKEEENINDENFSKDELFEKTHNIEITVTTTTKKLDVVKTIIFLNKVLIYVYLFIKFVNVKATEF